MSWPTPEGALLDFGDGSQLFVDDCIGAGSTQHTYGPGEFAARLFVLQSGQSAQIAVSVAPPLVGADQPEGAVANLIAAPGEAVELTLRTVDLGYQFPIAPVQGDASFSGLLPNAATVMGGNNWGIDFTRPASAFVRDTCDLLSLQAQPADARFITLGYLDDPFFDALSFAGRLSLALRGAAIAQTEAALIPDYGPGTYELVRIFATGPSTVRLVASCPVDARMWPNGDVVGLDVEWNLTLAEGWNLAWLRLEPGAGPRAALYIVTPDALGQLQTPIPVAGEPAAALPFRLF